MRKKDETLCKEQVSYPVEAWVELSMHVYTVYPRCAEIASVSADITTLEQAGEDSAPLPRFLSFVGGVPGRPLLIHHCRRAGLKAVYDCSQVDQMSESPVQNSEVHPNCFWKINK